MFGMSAIRIALVDDDARTRRLLEEILHASGYQATAFDSGDRVLRGLSASQYDLLIVDVEMPGLDGFAVAREVRRRPHLQRLPILALTGLSTPQDAVRILEAGADAFIAKPADISELLELVAQLLQESQTHEEPSRAA